MSANCDKFKKPYKKLSVRNKMKRIRSLKEQKSNRFDETTFENTSVATFTSNTLQEPESSIIIPDCEVQDLKIENNTSTNMNNQKEISGRRFVDIAHFLKHIQAANDHSPFQCNLGDMDIVSEIRNGLINTFRFQCRMCRVIKHVTTEGDTDNNILDVNSSLVLATISAGLGFSQINQILSTVEMPGISRQKFDMKFETISTSIIQSSWDAIEEAGIEEAQLAREIGDVDENNVPCITVIADGAWSKRSYKTHYDAASGVACIIGAKTGKILFVGVRNKYCPICERAKSKNRDIKTHECYKNWSGTSTAMESDIILEGFKCSMEMHGLKYTQLVGDGDSSVYKKLCIEKPYGNNVLVRKIECRNHLLRNFSSRLRELSNKSVSSKMKPVSPSLRQILKTSIERVRIGISTAVSHRRNENNILTVQVSNLKKDILNCPKHVFGDHSSCDEYFCNGPKVDEINIVPQMLECGLFDDIVACCNRLIQNCHSLLLNMNNNAAETYNSVVAKFVGGKRINFSAKNSYTTRCHAACVSYNKNENYLSTIHKKLVQKSPGNFCKGYIDRLNKKRLYARRNKERLFASRYKKKRTVAPADNDYGLVVDNDFVPLDVIEDNKLKIINSLQKTPEEALKLERETVGQKINFFWKKERSLRLTASNFGSVCKLRLSTDPKKLANRVVNYFFCGSAATRWGNDHEEAAKQQFSEKYGLTINNCGLFVSADSPYLGASPDGLIGDDAIIEVKCPYKMMKLKLHPREAAANGKITYLTMEGEEPKLKKSHSYFYQIQGQLALTGREVCYFVVWTPLGMTCEKIKRDVEFWEIKMKPKLIAFYMSHMLPILAMKHK